MEGFLIPQSHRGVGHAVSSYPAFTALAAHLGRSAVRSTSDQGNKDREDQQQQSFHVCVALQSEQTSQNVPGGCRAPCWTVRISQGILCSSRQSGGTGQDGPGGEACDADLGVQRPRRPCCRAQRWVPTCSGRGVTRETTGDQAVRRGGREGMHVTVILWVLPPSCLSPCLCPCHRTEDFLLNDDNKR